MAPPSPTAPRAATVPWVLFGLDGRIGRQAYWLSFLLIMLLSYIAITPYKASMAAGTMQEQPGLYFWALVLVAVWTQFAIGAKRLHDRGLHGLFALLLLIPIINIGIGLVIGLMPGDPGPNRFGPHTDGRGRFG